MTFSLVFLQFYCCWTRTRKHVVSKYIHWKGKATACKQTKRESVFTPFSTFILYILPRTEHPAHRGSLFADKHIFILAETNNKNLVLSRSSSSKHDKITRTGSRESRLCENPFCHMLIVMIYL